MKKISPLPIAKTFFMNFFTENYSKYIAIFRLCGFSPVFKTKRYRMLMVNLLRLFYICLVSLVVAIYFILMDQKELTEKSLNKLTTKSLFFTIIFTIFVNLLEADLTKKSHTYLFNKINEVDHLIRERLCMNINYKEEKRMLNKKLGVSIFVCLVTSSTTFINDDQNTKELIRTIISGFCNLFLAIRCLQYFFYINIIHLRLIILIKSLKSILIIPKISTLYCEGYDNQNCFSTTKKIKYTKHIFGIIHQLTNTINDCFGWSLLSIMMSFFMNFTLNGYLLVLNALQTKSIPAYFTILGRMIPKLYLLIFIVYVITTCQEKVTLCHFEFLYFFM